MTEVSISSKLNIEQDFYNMLMEAPAAIAIIHGPDHVFTLANPMYQKIFGRSKQSLIGRTIRQVWPEVEYQGVFDIFDSVYKTGETFKAEGFNAVFEENGSSKSGFFDFIAKPLKDADGKVKDIMVHAVDVTENVLARKKIEESEERFVAAVKAVEGIIWTNSADGRMVGVQPGWAALTGQKYHQYQGFGWAEALHPDDSQSTIVAWNEAVKHRKPFIHEHRVKKKDGTWGEFLVKAVPVQGQDGSIREWVGVHTEITESRRAELALKESEEKMRLFVEHAPAAMAMFDLEMRYVAVSQRWVRSFNLSKSIIGQSHYSTFPTLPETWKDTHRRALQGSVEKSEEDYLITPDGSVMWLKWEVHPWYRGNNQIGGIVIFSEDITDRKKAEEALRQSEQRLQKIADSIPQMVWMADAQGLVQWQNKRNKGFFGDYYKGLDWMAFLHPDDVQRTMDVWQDAVTTGKIYEIEYRFFDRISQEYRWFLVKALPLRNGEGTVTNWFGSCTDIHEKKVLTEQLESLVKERTKELQRSNEDLQQFAHVASHDLKEPVRKIRTFTSRIQREYSASLPERANTYLHKIEESAARMYSMIDGVLHYSSLKAFQQSVEMIDLNAICRSIESDLEVLIAESGVKILFDSLPKISGFQTLIYQLFYNLVNNSFKFIKPGVPLVVEISADHPSSEEIYKLNLAENKTYIRITVKDNGIGFPEKYAEKIFIPFTRLHAKDRYEGTGLGLSLCRKIAERHGGAIYAIGDEENGAKFIVVLPLAS